MNIDKVIDGLVKYFNAKMLPAMNDWQKILAIDVVGRTIKQTVSIREKIAENTFLRALGYIDSEGNVDVDGIAAYLKSYIKERGLIEIKIPFMPVYKVSESDIDDIYKVIMKG